MNINHNLFYRDLVSEENKARLYGWSLDMVALITGVIKVSGGRLAVARVGHHYIVGETAPSCSGIYLVDKAMGFMVLKLSMVETDFVMRSPHSYILKRGRDRSAMFSKNPKRLVAALKGSSAKSGVSLMEYLISSARSWRMVQQIHATVSCANNHYKTSSYFGSMLDGKEQFELLNVLLGDSLFSGVPTTQQEKYKTVYAAHCKQRDTNAVAHAKIVDIFTKPLWVFSLSQLGLIVGCATYPLDAEGQPNTAFDICNVLVPFTLYKDVHSIPDVALREEIITTLTMARVNRANNPKYADLRYLPVDSDNFFPLRTDKVFEDSQSIAVTDNEHTESGGHTEVVTFVIPR
jgi:hypothetical protein